MAQFTPARTIQASAEPGRKIQRTCFPCRADRRIPARVDDAKMRFRAATEVCHLRIAQIPPAFPRLHPKFCLNRICEGEKLWRAPRHPPDHSPITTKFADGRKIAANILPVYAGLETIM